MSELIAFLRAINVGGRQAKNTDLRAAFERMGYADVDTFIASGNVIFSTRARSSAALERKIEDALEQEFGLEMTTFLRTRAEVAAILAELPTVEHVVHVPYAGGTDDALPGALGWPELLSGDGPLRFEPVAFDQNGGNAQLPGADGGHVAAGAAADDQQRLRE